jgi:sugar phosphate isomerase/epimerase
MRIGYNTWSMATVPYQVFIPELHRIGYTAIAISVKEAYGIGGRRVPNAAALDVLTRDDRRRIKQEFEQRDLRLPAVIGNQPLVEDDPQRHAAAMQRLKDTIDLCVELAPRGQPLPTMNTGSDGRSADFEARKQQIVDRCGELARYGASRGVTVCLEPHVNGAIDTPQRATWLVEAVGHTHFAIDFDISHFEVVGIPMEQSVPPLVPVTKSVEIKDQAMRLASTPTPEGWRVPGNGMGRASSPDDQPVEFQFLLGGEGDFDLPQFLRLMREQGWTDPISFEASVQCQARPGYDALAAATSTFAWMRAGWEAAGIPLE